jgi:hypothetical protein
MRSTNPGSGASLPRCPQIPHIPGRQGYAVVSCHVERPLDDAVWARYRSLIARRPGGFPIASLLRPPADGEDEERFLVRAREASALGPFGHHTHWTSPTHARPTGGDPAAQVLREGRWLREQGLEARLFCGGGWYMDADVFSAIADLRYVDLTATPVRPVFLPPGSPRAALDGPAWVRLGDGRRVLEVPSTHSLGSAARGLTGLMPPHVHVHFHDYELLDAKRRAALSATLRLLALRRRPLEPGAVESGREVALADVCAD